MKIYVPMALAVLIVVSAWGRAVVSAAFCVYGVKSDASNTAVGAAEYDGSGSFGVNRNDFALLAAAKTPHRQRSNAV